MTSRSTSILLAAMAMSVFVHAQVQLDPSLLGKPPVDAWPTYHGDYSGRHYSTLNQINQSNVRQLTLSWLYRANTNTLGAISGGAVPEAVAYRLGPGALAGGLLKATPLAVNGVLYMSAPDHAWAIDAHSGREIWHFFWRTKGGDHIGNRGLGMYGNWLYFETPDGYVVSLDAATGKERWHKQIVDVRSEYFTTVAPVLIKNHLILGMGGDALDVPGWLESRDPDTGEIQWKWYTTPRTGEPGAATWPDAYAMEHGGGMPWTPVTYDPELNLIYVPTGNPNPVYRGDARKGANLYTASIVALNADTGKMAWYFQASPHDTHDWDATQVPILFDATFNGQRRKLLAQASRNGIFFLLDRATGQNLLSLPYIESANWYKGFDDRGQPIPNPEKEASTGGALVSPNNGGGQNWAPPTYSPETGLIYMNAAQGYEIHYKWDVDGPTFGSAGHAAHAVGGLDTSLRAFDPLTGKSKWIHKYQGTEWNPPRPELLGGLLSTAGRLVFAGAPGNFIVAYDPSTGRQLWHAGFTAPMSNTPITYMLNGKQQLVIAAGDTLYAFSLQQ
jgi:acido-empty-quinoprotein group A